MEHEDWQALGTGVRLVVQGGDLGHARSAVERVLADVDRACSRFRDDSELMRLRSRRGAPGPVSPLLARAIRGALDAAIVSGGALDPTVGGAMRVIGYDADWEVVARGGRGLELRLAPVPGWQLVDFDPATGLLRVPPGVELDLGATGKGLAADLAAQAALEAMTDQEPGAEVGAGPGAPHPACGVLVSLGGDIATAGDSPDGGWRVTLAEDHRADPAASGLDGSPPEVVAIDRGAVATSSTTVRRWRAADGTTRHHVVDPRTGLPAVTPWRTVTVAGATCEAANGASTAAIVLGEAAPDWLAARGLPARLVATDGSVTYVNGWPAA